MIISISKFRVKPIGDKYVIQVRILFWWRSTCWFYKDEEDFGKLIPNVKTPLGYRIVRPDITPDLFTLSQANLMITTYSHQQKLTIQ